MLISEITSFLKQADSSVFASPAHVKWFMEVIGQGFNLPLEDMAITDSDVDIYAKWLFEPTIRPAAVVNEGLEQEFYQIIFHQFSLLFQPRIAKPVQQQPKPTTSTSNHTNRNNQPFHINMLPVAAHNNIIPMTFNTNAPSTPNSNNTQSTAIKETLAQLVQRHIELCKKTLKVFAMAGRTLKLSTETWAVLLKVMLGITDYLLKEPVAEQSGVMNMADELCDNLLQVSTYN